MKNASQKYHIKIYVIIGIFFLSIAIRFVLANFYPKTINCYPDELLYLSFGESLWNNHALLVGNMPSVFDKAAYPILIAPSFIFSDVKVQGMMIDLINSLLMSLHSFGGTSFACYRAEACDSVKESCDWCVRCVGGDASCCFSRLLWPDY